jgi:hypothetical protein
MRRGRVALALVVVAAAAFAAVPVAQVASAQPGWSAPSPIDQSSPITLDSVSCATSTFCAGDDFDNEGSIYNGSHWSTPTSIEAFGPNSGTVSCASTTFCVAGNDQGGAIMYNGTSWTVVDADPNGGVGLTSMSCPTPTFCAAGDSSGNVAMWDGEDWSVTPVEPGTSMSSMSCASPSFCMALDNDGKYTVYSGGSWSAPTTIDTSTSPTDEVSCTATPSTLCAVVDNYGDAYMYNGSSWTTDDGVDGSELTAVSCATATFCTAVDNAGNAVVYDGSDWSGVENIDSSNSLNSVSCPTASFCVAVDSDGNSVVYGGTTPTVAVSDVSPNNGPTAGSTTVTITGSGFDAGSQVEFGGVVATVLSVTGTTSISASSPASPGGTAGTVDVIVTTGSASSTPNPADEFTYTEQDNASNGCPSDACDTTDSTPLDETQVGVTGTSEEPSASLALQVNNGVTLTCPGKYDYPTAVTTLTPSGSFAADAVLTVTETVGHEPSTSGVKVCFAPTGESTGSLLGTCPKHHAQAPCVKKATEDDGSVVAKFLVPANDPRFWTGDAALKLKAFSPTSGKPQSKVTITGTSLTQVTAVVFGGTQARIVSESATKVVAQVPAGAVTGLITVTADSGAVTSVKSFKVT